LGGNNYKYSSKPGIKNVRKGKKDVIDDGNRKRKDRKVLQLGWVSRMPKGTGTRRFLGGKDLDLRRKGKKKQ